MKSFELKNNIWLFVAVLLVCFAVSVGVRYQQFETWKLNPQAYFVGERPMMTTLDAPYWLRWAREYNKRKDRLKSGLRGYPESTPIFGKRNLDKLALPTKYKDESPSLSSSTNLDSFPQNPGISYRDVPLLSFLIAHLSPLFNYNYYLTGTLLIPVFASLFILPLGIYFFRIGEPVSGLLGGLIGTFAGGYYMRSSIGRIDTDMLNLFFPVLAGVFILLAGKVKSERLILLYALGSGLSMFLLDWWYDKPGFTLVYFSVLVFSLFVQKIRFQTILLSGLLFVLCSFPANFMNGSASVQSFLKGYFIIEAAQETAQETAQEGVYVSSNNPAIFPNTRTTISEVNHVPMLEVFRRVLSNTTVVWIGFLGILGMFIFKWRVLLPLLPMLALGLFSFQSSNRFIMYLAPFIGIGLGWLFQLGIGAIFLTIKKNFGDRVVKHKGVKR